jgi:hypothetical protein
MEYAMKHDIWCIAVIALAMVIAACSHDGAVVKINAPQAGEQCNAQPGLDWCHAK